MKHSVDQALRKAASLSAAGDVDGAERLYRSVLERFPANKRAIDGMRALSAPKDAEGYAAGLGAVLDLYEQGRLGEAIEHVRLLIKLYPSQADPFNLAGAAHAGLGQFAEAIEAYDAALEIRSDYAEVRSNRASALIGLGRHAEALADCDAAIRILPRNAQAHSNRGIALKNLGRPLEAVAAQDSALRLMPNAAEIHYNRANALLDLGRCAEAVDGYDRAIALRSTHIGAHSNRGQALHALGRLEEALDAYGRALALDPAFAQAHSNLGRLLLDLGRGDEAVASCRKATELQPNNAEVHHNLSVALEKLMRFDQALAACEAAITCESGHARAHGNRGHLLFKLGRTAEAADSYAEAVRLDPDNENSLYALGNLLQDLGRLDDAIDCYNRMIALDPTHDGAIAQLAYQRARMCDWSEPSPDLAALPVNRPVTPLIFTWLADEPQLQLRRAAAYAAQRYPAIAASPPRPAERPAKVRIGYFSAEFHDHAVMFQLARMFELHDRDRFVVTAYSFGPAQPSPMRSRLIEAFDMFRDVAALNPREIADLARADGIDVAIDLMGYSGQARPEIFAARAAPVQMQYLGYPGTMGAPFIDYLVGDATLIPENEQRHYAEKIVYLPDSYQANDNRRAIASDTPSRAALGLPDDAFVFCSFNNSHKITPAEFDIWMRLLGRVDGSVLWLFAANAAVEGNLRAEAAKRGVDPRRLVFAGKMPHADHLARLRQADLFLDCFACNAHATAGDALWAGVPVLTMPGQGFAARVGASLCHAIGLSDLVVATAADYERIACELATDPGRLAALRDRLARHLTTMPLFDSERFTRHIETAYEMAYDRYWNGLEPDHIRVPRGSDPVMQGGD